MTIWYSSSLCIVLNRIWPLWAADLWGSSQDATVSEENAGSDWSPGSWEAEPEKQTHCYEPSAIWNHCTLWVCETDSWGIVCNRVHVTPYLPFYLQSLHAVRGKRREMARTTALWRGKRWRRTSRRAVTWRMASTTATFMAPRSTLSTKWWMQAVPASWTSILRLVKGTHSQYIDVFLSPKALVVTLYFLPRPWKCWRLLSLCHLWCLLLLLNWTH